MKFTGRTRRARGRRGLGRTQPPGPPERPGAGRSADRDHRGRRRAACCRPSTTRPPPGPRSRRPCRTRARPWSPVACSPTSAAACPNKPVEMSIDGAKVVADLRLGPVHPPDHAGRGVPAPCPTMPQATGIGAAATLFAHAVARRSPPPVATTCCRCSPVSGSRSRAPRSRCSATDRFRLSLRELAWDPGATDVSAAALVPAKVLADTAKSLTAGAEVHHRAVRLRRRRGHHRLRGCGRRRRTAYHDPAAGRGVPEGPHPVPDRAPTVARVDRAALVDGGQAGVARRRAQHRRAAGVQRQRPHARRRAAVTRRWPPSAIEAPGQGRGHHDRVQPPVPPRRARARSRSRSWSWPSPRPPSPR